MKGFKEKGDHVVVRRNLSQGTITIYAQDGQKRGALSGAARMRGGGKPRLGRVAVKCKQLRLGEGGLRLYGWAHVGLRYRY